MEIELQDCFGITDRKNDVEVVFSICFVVDKKNIDGIIKSKNIDLNDLLELIKSAKCYQ